MADPTDVIPHLMGINVSGGVSNTLIIALNRANGERIRQRTDSNDVVIFDALDFTSAYSQNDVIEFHNVGGSVGVVTITISDATGGFQEATLSASAASTVSVSL